MAHLIMNSEAVNLMNWLFPLEVNNHEKNEISRTQLAL
jgi:hypothetical protein